VACGLDVQKCTILEIKLTPQRGAARMLNSLSGGVPL
jgi:hypothetical protein